MELELLSIKQLAYASLYVGIAILVGVVVIISLQIRASFKSQIRQINQEQIKEIIEEACKNMDGVREMLAAVRSDQRRAMGGLTKVLETQASLHTMATTGHRNSNENAQNVHINTIPEKAKENEQVLFQLLGDERKKMENEISHLRRELKRMNENKKAA